MKDKKEKSKKKLITLIVVGIILISIIIGVYILNNNTMTQELLPQNLEGKYLQNSFFYNSGTGQEFGYDYTNGTFNTMDGLSYKNSSGGYLNVYRDEKLIRKFGFGITSEQANRSTADFDWSWNYYDSTKTWSATNITQQFYWNINYKFIPNSPIKITHQVNNTWKNITNTKMWYIFTVYEGDIINYNGINYDWNDSINIDGSSINNKLIFNEYEEFDFSDIFIDYDVTNFYIGDASMFNYPNINIVALGITKGNGNFNKYSNYTLDPTYTYTNILTNATLSENIRSEPTYSHLAIHNESLLLYLPFDVNNNSNGITYDYSNNNHDGTITNATFTTDGKYGGAYYFNRTSNIITPSTYSMTAGQNYIISAWIKVPSFGGITDYLTIGGHGDGASCYGGYLRIYTNDVQFGSSAGSGKIIEDLNTETWYHVVSVSNSSGTTGYLNGIIQNSIAVGTATCNNQEFGIGGLKGYVQQFNGTIDEFMIWNTSLSSTDVQNLYLGTYQKFYNNGNQTFEMQNVSLGTDDRVNVTVQGNATNDSSMSVRIWEANYDSVVNDDLILYMHMDNLSEFGEDDTLVYDFSGRGHNGTATENATFTTMGKYNGAYNFSVYNNGGYLNTGIYNSNFYTGDGGFAFATWIYNPAPIGLGSTSSPGWVTIFATRSSASWGDSSVINFRRSYSKTSYIELIIRDGYSVLAGTETDDLNLQTNTWYHVAISWNKTTNDTFIYLDGSLVHTNTTGLAFPDGAIGWTYIGYGYDVAPKYFNGTIDETMLFNRTLSSDEIKSLYYTSSTDHRNDGDGLDWTESSTGEQTLSYFNSTHLRASDFVINSGSDYLLTDIGFDSTNGFYSGVLENVNVETFTAGTGEIDNEYPFYSNYSDNNGTLVDSGTGIFNVSVSLSNGTVYLYINNTNLTATNYSSDPTMFNVTYDFTAGGNYPYYWISYGNGSLNNFNMSLTRDYTVNTSISDSCSPSSPLSANHQFECSDNCVITSDVNANGFNVLLNGTGIFTLQANITNWTIFRKLNGACNITCYDVNGGCIRRR